MMAETKTIYNNGFSTEHLHQHHESWPVESEALAQAGILAAAAQRKSHYYAFTPNAAASSKRFQFFSLSLSDCPMRTSSSS